MGYEDSIVCYAAPVPRQYNSRDSDHFWNVLELLGIKGKKKIHRIRGLEVNATQLLSWDWARTAPIWSIKVYFCRAARPLTDRWRVFFTFLHQKSISSRSAIHISLVTAYHVSYVLPTQLRFISYFLRHVLWSSFKTTLSTLWSLCSKCGQLCSSCYPALLPDINGLMVTVQIETHRWLDISSTSLIRDVFVMGTHR
jgi:hypothetical protein